MRLLTGQGPEDPCRDAGTSDHYCFEPAHGSGWYLVQSDELGDPTRLAGHCWFDSTSVNCGGDWSAPRGWTAVPGTGFSLDATAKWLTTRTGE